MFMRMIFGLAILFSLAGTAAAPAQEKLNHLAAGNSPYLKRAISQPVDWYPWGAAAFGRAKELDRPILLDVGAVWCPWCDLMDRDTYTNAATAAPLALARCFLDPGRRSYGVRWQIC